MMRSVYMALPYLLVWYFTAFAIPLQSQSYNARLLFGTYYYQGDLTPRTTGMSFGPGNFCWGISTGINITDWMSINGRFMSGKLDGNDAYSPDQNRKSRNLSFVSPIYEYGIYTDVLLNKLWKGLDKYKLKLFVTAGLNLIHFNPSAQYKGTWVHLQPLGTEGQTLAGSGKQKYSLYNISRPLGLIIEFDFFKRISLGIEVSPRKTWTDYLDDVSGTYADYDAMVASGNVLGAQLSNRMGEYLNSEPIKVPAGTARGKADKNDWYTFFGMYFKYKFGKIRNEPEPLEIREKQ